MPPRAPARPGPFPASATRPPPSEDEGCPRPAMCVMRWAMVITVRPPLQFQALPAFHHQPLSELRVQGRRWALVEDDDAGVAAERATKSRSAALSTALTHGEPLSAPQNPG